MNVNENEVTYGMDWIAATTTDPNLGERWYMDYLAYRETRPLFEKEWVHQGGYLGREVEGFAWGQSMRLGFIIRGTGATAERVYPSVQHERARITRLDLRVDVSCLEYSPDVARLTWVQNQDSLKPQYRLNLGPTGQTCYIGSMSSDVFGRLYDKGGERGLGQGLMWRYEVVYRKEQAIPVLDALKARGIQAIPEIVGEYFASRNAVMVFRADGPGVHRAEAKKGDVDAKLDWLRKSVQKTVLRLVEGGYRTETLQALGLEPEPYREFDKP